MCIQIAVRLKVTQSSVASESFKFEDNYGYHSWPTVSLFIPLNNEILTLILHSFKLFVAVN